MKHAKVEPKSSPVATVGDLKAFLASVPDDLPIDRGFGDDPMVAVVRPFRPARDEDPYVVEGCGLRLVFVEYDDWYEPSDE